MYPVKIGLQLASLRLPLKQGLLAAARLGVQGIQLDARHSLRPEELSQTGLRHLKKMLDDLNLRVCAVEFRTRRGYDVPDELERRIDGTKKAMQLAYRLGTNVVVNHIGRVPDESEGPAWQLLLQSLADLGRHGQHVGAMLAAVTGSESGERLAALLGALPTGALAISFDPGNLIVHGHDARRALELLADQVLHVHATDGVRDTARGRGLETPLGRGSVDFPLLLSRLEEEQYRGYFTIVREQVADPLTELGHAVQYLRNIQTD